MKELGKNPELERVTEIIDLEKSYSILFAAKLAASVDIRLTDADFRDWSIFSRMNHKDDDGVNIGLFALWNEFLASRGVDLCQDCWNGFCAEEE